MKKIILLLAVSVLFCSKMFAGVVLRECISSFGLYSETFKSPFFEEENYSTNEFLFNPFMAVDVSALYEIEPKEKFHLTTGLTLGCAYDNYILLALNFGTAFQITPKVDFKFSVCPGSAIFFAFEGSIPNYYLKSSLEFEIMPFGRNNVFFSPGISNHFGFSYKNYETFGDEWEFVDMLLFSFAAGYRF